MIALRRIIGICVLIFLVGVFQSVFAFAEVTWDLSSSEIDTAEVDSVVEVGEIRVEESPVSLYTRVLRGETFHRLVRQEFPPSAFSVADVLEKLPGASIVRSGMEGALTSLSLRGALSSQVLVMVNGSPIALPGGTPIDLSLFDLSTLEAVEFVTGISYGSRAIGGAVNIITGAEEAEEPASLIERAKLATGSFSTFRASASGGRRGESFASSLFIGAFHSDGDFSFASRGTETHKRVNNKSNRLNLLYAQNSWDSKSLRKVSYFASLLRRGVPGFAEFPTPFANLTEGFFSVGFNGLRVADDANRWDREFAAAFQGSFIRFTDSDPLLGGDIRARTRELDGSLEVSLYRDSGERVTGSVYYNQMLASDYGNPSRLSARLSVSDSFDLGGFSVSPLFAVNLAEGLPTVLSGGISFERRLSNTLWLNGSVARMFRYPDFAELYYPSVGFVRGNPDLRSERANLAEVGFQFTQERLEASVVGYLREQENSIRFVPISAYALAAVNTGEVDVRGIEFALNAELSDEMSASFSGGYTDSRYTASGIELTQTPKYKVLASLRTKLRKWEASASYFRESSQSADLFGSLRVPSKEIVNVEISGKVKGGVFRLGIQNLLDKPAYDFLSMPLPGRYLEASFERRF